MATTGLDGKRALALSAVSLLMVPLVVFLFGVASVVMEGLSEGSGCRIDVNPGSGRVGDGRVEIHWGVSPAKYCVGRLDGRLVEDLIQPSELVLLLIYPIAAGAGVLVWITGRELMLRPGVLRRDDGAADRGSGVWSSAFARLLVVYAAGVVVLWGVSFVGALNWGVARTPLHLSTTPGRDLLGGVLWSSGVAAAMSLGGYLIGRRSRAGPVLAVGAWLVGVLFAFRGWAHSCVAANGAGCDGRGFVSIGILAALTTGMVAGFLLAWPDRRASAGVAPPVGGVRT